MVQAGRPPAWGYSASAEGIPGPPGGQSGAEAACGDSRRPLQYKEHVRATVERKSS